MNRFETVSKVQKTPDGAATLSHHFPKRVRFPEIRIVAILFDVQKVLILQSLPGASRHRDLFFRIFIM